jgi:hypothetical protein
MFPSILAACPTLLHIFELTDVTITNIHITQISLRYFRLSPPFLKLIHFWCVSNETLQIVPINFVMSFIRLSVHMQQLKSR